MNSYLKNIESFLHICSASAAVKIMMKIKRIRQFSLITNIRKNLLIFFFLLYYLKTWVDEWMCTMPIHCNSNAYSVWCRLVNCAFCSCPLLQCSQRSSPLHHCRPYSMSSDSIGSTRMCFQSDSYSDWR